MRIPIAWVHEQLRFRVKKLRMASLTREVVSSFNTEKLCKYLTDQGQSQDVITAVEENKLTGIDFLELTTLHSKELVPVLGPRMSVQRLIISLTLLPEQQHRQQPVKPVQGVSFGFYH